MSAQCWLFAENLLQLGFTQIDRNTHMSADNTQDHLHSKLMLVMVTFTGHKADAAILHIADFCRQHLRPACIAFERRASRRTFEIANERCTLLHIHVHWLNIALFKCGARLIYSAKVKIAQLCQICKLFVLHISSWTVKPVSVDCLENDQMAAAAAVQRLFAAEKCS